MTRYLPLLAAFSAACRTPDDPDPLLRQVAIQCQDVAAVSRDKILMSALTDAETLGVQVELLQDDAASGPYAMEEVDTGEWFTDAWESETVVDCDAPFGARFVAWDRDGNPYYFDY